MKTKILSLLEIGLVFILMIWLFRDVQSIPLAINISNSFNSLPIPGYTVLLIASICIYIFRCPGQTKNPFSKQFKYQLEIIGSGFFPIFILSVVLSWIDWTQLGGAILISIIEIGLLIWLAWMVKDKQPSQQNIGVLSGFILLPVASIISTKLGNVIISIIYFYFFVAMSEEILFRGYIQSKLNTVFGRPRSFFGTRWGWGLIISSLVFGLWHLGWSTGIINWPHVLWTLFSGLIFGFVREKSESIIAPTILHGILNYGPQAILFFLFWSK